MSQFDYHSLNIKNIFIFTLIFSMASCSEEDSDCVLDDYCNNEIVLKASFPKNSSIIEYEFVNNFRNVAFDKRLIPIGYDVSGRYIEIECKVGKSKYVGSYIDWDLENSDLHVINRGDSLRFSLDLRKTHVLSDDASDCSVIYAHSLKDWIAGERLLIYSRVDLPEGVMMKLKR